MYNYLFIRLSIIKDLNNLNLLDNINTEWLLTDSAGKVIEIQKKPEVLSQVQIQNTQPYKLVLIIPDYLVSYHVTQIPIKDKIKRAQAAQYILEDKISSDIDKTTLIVGPEVDLDEYLVAAIDQESLINIIDSFNKNFSKPPSVILTDALCLYKPRDVNYNLYFNNTNNLGLIISKNIIVTYLKNFNLVFEQIRKKEKTPINLEIYKHNINNINDFFDLNNIVITSEQEITDWLPFLVSNWFANKNNNKINLAGNLINQNKLDLRFNSIWKYTASLFSVFCFSLIIYKYIDSKIYTDRKIQLDSMIKTVLRSADLNTTDLNKASKLIDRQVIKLEDDVKKERINNEFQVLLGAFTGVFKPAFKINQINFKDHKLQVNFTLTKNNNHYLENIDTIFSDRKIDLNQSVKTQNNTFSVTWTMSLL